jgi:hypothetical protein
VAPWRGATPREHRVAGEASAEQAITDSAQVSDLGAEGLCGQSSTVDLGLSVSFREWRGHTVPRRQVDGSNAGPETA